MNAYRDALPQWNVTVTRPDGSEFTSCHLALTASDAVASEKRRYPGLTVRLATTPGLLHRAAYAVARDQVQGEDSGFLMVRDAVHIARNTLRLPEEPYVPGGYPIDDDGSDLAWFYRLILEATDAELEDAVTLEGSVRAQPEPIRGF